MNTTQQQPTSTTVVVPMRKGSQRIINKNVRPIGNFRYGLMEIKLRQLSQCGCFDVILIDTDIDDIQEILDETDIKDNRFRIEHRSPEFGDSSTTTDDLIQYMLAKIETDTFVWTHVTSPFFTAEHYHQFVNAFNNLGAEHDSLMAVNVLKEFVWTKEGPLNYARGETRWPFTQSIQPVYIINSSAFAISTSLAIHLGDRIGDHPAFFECDGITGIDVDWASQFELVELLVGAGKKVV